LTSIYRWTSGEPFSPFTTNVCRKNVISVRRRCCARGEERRFARLFLRCQARILIDRWSTSWLRPVRFPLSDVQSICCRPCCVMSSRGFRRCDDASPPLPPTRLTRVDVHNIVLRGYLGYENACGWKTCGIRCYAHVTYQLAISIFKSRYRSRPGLRNVVSRDHVPGPKRVTMWTLNWSTYEWNLWNLNKSVKFFCEFFKEQ